MTCFMGESSRRRGRAEDGVGSRVLVVLTYESGVVLPHTLAHSYPRPVSCVGPCSRRDRPSDEFHGRLHARVPS